MHKRRITRREVKCVSAIILAVVAITWRMGVHNARRMQRWQDRQEQEIRVEIEQDAADRAAGIIPIEDLVEEEYE